MRHPRIEQEQRSMPDEQITLSGIYPPLPTFFDAREELDLTTYQQHMSNLAGTGIAGYVVMGTNGESVHLTSDERVQVLEAAREAAGSNAQIIAGCGEQSTRATIANCRRAATAGADAALVLPPSYYKGLMDRRALLVHYHTIADSSPLPVLIYNMPASAAGLDLDAVTICILAEHPNIIGVKDSAGGGSGPRQLSRLRRQRGLSTARPKRRRCRGRRGAGKYLSSPRLPRSGTLHCWPLGRSSDPASTDRCR